MTKKSQLARIPTNSLTAYSVGDALGLAQAVPDLVGTVRDLVQGYNARELVRVNTDAELLLGESVREDARTLAEVLARDLERMPEQVRNIYWLEIVNQFRRKYGKEDLG